MNDKTGSKIRDEITQEVQRILNKYHNEMPPWPNGDYPPTLAERMAESAILMLNLMFELATAEKYGPTSGLGKTN